MSKNRGYRLRPKRHMKGAAGRIPPHVLGRAFGDTRRPSERPRVVVSVALAGGGGDRFGQAGRVSDKSARDQGQPLPTRRRVRFFFELEPGDLRAVFWVELDSEAGDFYWGPPTDGPAVEAQPFSGTSATITIPEDLDSYARQHWKASHHASGVMHVTGDPSRPNDRWWGRLEGLATLRRFCVILSKHPTSLPPYTRSPTRGGSAAVVLRLPENQRATRHYLELFLSPAGTFTMPQPAIAFEDAVDDRPIVQSLSEELDLLLVVRHLVLGGPLSAWQPETQLWLTVDPDAPAEGGST